MHQHDEERSNKYKPGFSRLDDDAWTRAGQEHHSELLSLHRLAPLLNLTDVIRNVIDPDANWTFLPSRLATAECSGPSLTAEEFGIEVEKIGKQISPGIRQKYARLAIEQSTVLATNVTAALIEILIDVDPKRVTFLRMHGKVSTIHNLAMTSSTANDTRNIR